MVLQEQQPPEVSRTPLHQLCLTVKTRFGDDYKLLDVLSQMLTPPPTPAITSAAQSLSSLGALDEDEALTALGRLLSQIPMDPRLAKTCIFACMLRSVCYHMLAVHEAVNVNMNTALLSSGFYSCSGADMDKGIVPCTCPTIL